VKAVDDKSTAERWRNELNHMMTGRVVPMPVPRIAWLIGKGLLTEQQGEASH
jgi:hypothetical protein